MGQLATMPLYLERLQDGPDALPRGTRHTRIEDIPLGVRRTHEPVGIGMPAAHEIYLMRTRPELYPEWLVDQAMEHRDNLVRIVNTHTPVYDWDCRACQHAVLTHVLDSRCPLCGN